jgi:hypothetical protein
MALDSITTALKLGRPIAKLMPVVGGNLEAGVDLAIGICEHTQVCTARVRIYCQAWHLVLLSIILQGIKSNKEESRSLATHCALCTTIMINHAQKGTLDPKLLDELKK